MPAVSTKRTGPSGQGTTASTASRVVPASSNTTDRSSPTSRLNRLDFPTFGRPTSANRGCSAPASPFAGASGSSCTMRSSRSPRRAPVHAGHRERLAEPERMEDGRVGLVLLGVDLVRDHDHRHTGPAEPRRQHAVVLGDAGLGVDDQQDEVGARERLVGLAARERLDARRTVQVSGGVDEGEAAAAPHGVELDAIARDPGHVVGDRLPVAEQAVDQGRLADVLPSDDRDAGYRRGSAARTPSPCSVMTAAPGRAHARPRARPRGRRRRRARSCRSRPRPARARCGFVCASRASRPRRASSTSSAATARSATRRRARNSGGRLQVELHRRVGEHDGGDVSTLHHRPVGLAQLALLPSHVRAHDRVARHARDRRLDLDIGERIEVVTLDLELARRIDAHDEPQPSRQARAARPGRRSPHLPAARRPRARGT